MGRLKFEKEFKEKLDRREIKPSEDSWGKLSSQLDSEEKSSKFNFWWLGIAATILAGILIIGLQYKNSPIESTPQVVDAPLENVDIKQQDILGEKSTREEEAEKIPVLKNENIKSEDAIAENSNVVPSKKSPKSNSAVEKSAKNISTKKRTTIVASAVVPTRIEPEIRNSTIYNSKADKLITQKLSEVIAQVNKMHLQGNSVSDAEVNKLLAQAAKQIDKERNYNFAVGKIDPDELLQAVEMDIEYSFREKIFDVLKEGYLKAKTAVANRNY